jgi:hypothetical protein
MTGNTIILASKFAPKIFKINAIIIMLLSENMLKFENADPVDK